MLLWQLLHSRTKIEICHWGHGWKLERCTKKFQIAYGFLPSLLSLIYFLVWLDPKPVNSPIFQRNSGLSFCTLTRSCVPCETFIPNLDKYNMAENPAICCGHARSCARLCRHFSIDTSSGIVGRRCSIAKKNHSLSAFRSVISVFKVFRLALGPLWESWQLGLSLLLVPCFVKSTVIAMITSLVACRLHILFGVNWFLLLSTNLPLQ